MTLDIVGNIFSLSIAAVGLFTAAMYGLILFKQRAPGNYRYLYWLSFFVCLWTGVFYTYAFLFVNTAAQRAAIDIGPQFSRPIIFLFVVLTCGKALARLLPPPPPRGEKK